MLLRIIKIRSTLHSPFYYHLKQRSFESQTYTFGEPSRDAVCYFSIEFAGLVEPHEMRHFPSAISRYVAFRSAQRQPTTTT